MGLGLAVGTRAGMTQGMAVALVLLMLENVSVAVWTRAGNRWGEHTHAHVLVRTVTVASLNLKMEGVMFAEVTILVAAIVIVKVENTGRQHLSRYHSREALDSDLSCE